MYIVLFLHQTTTCYKGDVCKTRLYIVLFLHQTTTRKTTPIFTPCCISYYSYIKPQQILISKRITLSCISYYSYIKPQQEIETLTDGTSCISYYSYIKPQPAIGAGAGLLVVYRTIPTSNHNVLLNWYTKHFVVYRTIPTSNHNVLLLVAGGVVLYIVLFLHQTTTNFPDSLFFQSCISYYSYIKPQRALLHAFAQNVVYRTIPTSNHNSPCWLSCFTGLYIVLFLHQTTTYNGDIADNQHVTITFINKK